MLVLAFPGSLRIASTNAALLRAIAALAPVGVTFAYYHDLDALPHFSPDRAQPGQLPPPSVAHLRAAITEADAVLFCTPEYAYGLPGAFKNALDWLVGSGELVGKPVGALSAGPGADGGYRARAALTATLTALAADLIEPASFAVPFVRQVLGPDERVTDPAWGGRLLGAVHALQLAVERAAS